MDDGESDWFKKNLRAGYGDGNHIECMESRVTSRRVLNDEHCSDEYAEFCEKDGWFFVVYLSKLSAHVNFKLLSLIINVYVLKMYYNK